MPLGLVHETQGAVEITHFGQGFGVLGDQLDDALAKGQGLGIGTLLLQRDHVGPKDLDRPFLTAQPEMEIGDDVADGDVLGRAVQKLFVFRRGFAQAAGFDQTLGILRDLDPVDLAAHSNSFRGHCN